MVVASAEPKKGVDNLWNLYYKGRANGDGRLSEEQLVRKYRFIVNSIAEDIHSKQPPNIELDDLKSEGMVALLKLIRSYEVRRGIKFTTHAWDRVRGQILDYIRAETPNPRVTIARYHQVEQATSKLENGLGYKPRPEQLIEELSKPEYTSDPRNRKNPRVKAEGRKKAELIIKSARNAGGQLFFQGINSTKGPPVARILEEGEEEKIHHCGKVERYNLLQGKKDLDPFYIVQKKEIKNILQEGLTSAEKLSLELHYFVFYKKTRTGKKLGMTLAEIARILGLSKGRAIQIHSKSLSKIKSRLEEKGLDLKTCLRELI